MADDHGAADLVHEQQWSHLPWAADGATMSEFEASCQDALRSYDLLDSEPDATFDDITQVAATVTNSPVALVSFVDYETRKRFFKSTFGLDVRSLTDGPTPEVKAAIFDVQACKVVQGDDIFQVEDAESHQDFGRNLAVKNLGLKFYAGAVLRSPDGVPVGTLCVMDKQSRTLSEAQRRQLQILARSAEAAMEEHRQKTRRVSADWSDLQGLGSVSQGPSSVMDDDRDIYAAACPEASAGLPLTDFEKKCLRELSSYQILDTEPEAAFDDITEVAAVCCGCPVGIVSLVDYESRRGFFKSTFGLDVRQLPYGPKPEDKAAVFCVQACKIIQGDDVFEVEDATSHQVFCNNPTVKGLGLKFYAGAILRSPTGVPMGTLCVLDKEKRSLTEQQKRQLAMLARSTVEAMEQHKRKLKRLSDAAADGDTTATDLVNSGRGTSFTGSVFSAKGSMVSAKGSAHGWGGSHRGSGESAAPLKAKAAAPATAPSATAAAPAATAVMQEQQQHGSPVLVAVWALVILFLLVATALALSSRGKRMRGDGGGLAEHVMAWLGSAGLQQRTAEL